MRYLPWFGLARPPRSRACFGFVDLGYVRRLGLVELLIAAAGAAVAVAGFGSTYAAAAGTSASTSSPSSTSPEVDASSADEVPQPITDGPG